MQITASILSKLFDVLKNGDSRGVSLYHSIEEAAEDSKFLEKLYHAAINEGFAEAGTIQVYGLDMLLRLSVSAKRYNSFEDFARKNSDNAATVKNNIININSPVTAHVLGQDFNFSENRSLSPEKCISFPKRKSKSI
jgi:stalled ribosome rescue protein Dom34